MPPKSNFFAEKFSSQDLSQMKSFVNDLIEELNNERFDQSMIDQQYQLIGALIHNIYNQSKKDLVENQTQTQEIKSHDAQTQTAENKSSLEFLNELPLIPQELSDSKFDFLNSSLAKSSMFKQSFNKDSLESENTNIREKFHYQTPTISSEIRDKKNEKIRIKKSKSWSNLSSIKLWDISQPLDNSYETLIHSHLNLSESVLAKSSDFSSDDENKYDNDRSLSEKSRTFEYREGSYPANNLIPSGKLRKSPNHPAHITNLKGAGVLHKEDSEMSR